MKLTSKIYWVSFGIMVVIAIAMFTINSYTSKNLDQMFTTTDKATIERLGAEITKNSQIVQGLFYVDLIFLGLALSSRTVDIIISWRKRKNAKTTATITNPNPPG
jgi:hypothetical protein